MFSALPVAVGGSTLTVGPRSHLVSPTAPAPLPIHSCAARSCRRRGAVTVRAAMAGGAAGGAPDPYQVLGLSPGADTQAVQRSYRRALNDAKDDKERVAKIEAAHTSIMMSGLSQRLKSGGKGVAKEVKYADKAQYFPWRPRRFTAETKFVQIVGGIQALLAAWSLLSSVTAGTQPLITSALVGVVANVYKQNMINPAPAGSSDSKGQTFKNLWRGALLTVMATFLGTFVFFTLPDFAVSTLTQRAMPLWFYQNENTILCVATCAMNFIFSAFYR